MLTAIGMPPIGEESGSSPIRALRIESGCPGIGIFWAVYYGSERAELPGDATVPDPSQVDDTLPDTRGRTL